MEKSNKVIAYRGGKLFSGAYFGGTTSVFQIRRQGMINNDEIYVLSVDWKREGAMLEKYYYHKQEKVFTSAGYTFMYGNDLKVRIGQKGVYYSPINLCKRLMDFLS